MKNGTKRIFFLDELRGFAILAMIFHHFFLDAGNILYWNKGYEIFDFLCKFQPIFWGIFIIISGICSRLSRNSVKRGSIVFAGAMIITFVTAVIMPKFGMDGEQIYFGILHCLGVCMIITGLCKKLIEKINPYIGMAVTGFLFWFTYGISTGYLGFSIKLPESLYQTNWLMPFGIFSNTFESADYFAIFPWLFLFLFGAFFGHFAVREEFPKFMYKRHSKALCFVGKNALWFYLGHQVVIYGILYIVSLVLLIKI